MSQRGQTLLPGHTLLGEGEPFDSNGLRITNYGPGCAKCSCGAISPRKPNTARRKQWHREHKDAIRAGAES